jgi:hypothetical protein
MVDWRGTMGTVKIGEGWWRFLAAVMLVAVAWAMWIFYQLNPSPLITNAAFEAAAKAKQNAQGVIAPAAVPPEPKEPPINADKLKFSEALSIPEKK